MNHESTREHRFFGTQAGLPPNFANGLASADGEAKYDSDIAYMLSIVSAWAYSDAGALEEQLPFYGLAGADVERLSIENAPMLLDATAYLLRSSSGESGIIAFRGTMPTDAVAWLADFDATWADFGSHGRVHAGFYANVEALWDRIRSWLDRSTGALRSGDDESAGGVPKKPMKALYVTGHSLGAAMAVLAGARIIEDDRWPALLRAVYTYGQPMVGDGGFKEYCDLRLGKRLFRHVFDSDIVCRMPPRIVGRFEHFGHEFFSPSVTQNWQRSSKIRAEPAWLLTPAIVSAAFAFYARRIDLLHRVRVPYSMDDHSPTNYIKVSRHYTLRRRGARDDEPKRAQTSAHLAGQGQSS
jgi:Lipase (class 3)